MEYPFYDSQEEYKMSQTDLEKKVNTIYDVLIGIDGNPDVLKRYEELS